MQGTPIESLVLEDPICCVATKPVCSNYRSHVETGLPRWLSGKESTCQHRRRGFNPWVRMIPWRRKWQPTPVFLSGTSHGQRSLAGNSPWGPQSNTVGQLSMHVETREEQSRTNRASLGNLPGSPQGIYLTISWSCFSDIEALTRWEKLKVCCP